jgi:hypothetical protein
VAVSPLRALLAAQAQSTWNRLQREAGEASVVAAGLVALVAAIATAPPVYACFAVGRSFGRALAAGESVVAALTAFQALILAGAVVSGLLEQRMAFSMAGFRVYPIPRLTLLAAELAAGLLNLVPLLGSLCSLSLATGLSVGAPLGTPLFFLVAVQQLLWIALLQHATGMATRLVASSRLAMAALTAAAIALVLRLALAMDQGLPEAVGGLVRSVTAALQVLPFSQAYRGAEDVLRGHVAAGAARQIVMLAASALLFAIVAAAHFAAGVGRGARGRRIERPWARGGPVRSLARVFEGQVLASRDGHVAVYMPLVVSVCAALSVVAASEIQGRAAADKVPWLLGAAELWAGLPLVGLFLAILPTMDDVWLNQFGHDGPGVRGLLLLPLRPEQVLLGRTLGMARVQALKGAIAIGPLLVECRPAPSEIAWGLAAAGTVFLVVSACGHLVSARLPRRVEDGAFLGSRPTPLTAFLIPSAVQLPTYAVLILVYKAGSALGPWGPALGLFLLLVATAATYARLLPFLAARVMALREHLVEM